MLDEAMGLAKGQAGEFVASLGKQVKQNPLPVLLIGAGIGMMLLNRGKTEGMHHASSQGLGHEEWRTENRYRQLESARSGLSRMVNETEDAFSHRKHEVEAKVLELKQNAGEAIDAFKARVSQAGHALHETASGIRSRMDAGMHNAGEFASRTAHDVKAGIGDAKHKAQDFYDAYPLAVGAMGLAVGALIGASAPLSTLERDSLDGVADAANRAGAGLAGKASDMAGKAAEKAVAAMH
jgi:ElaB/YqjD/DUF883 family membrane-anchored ribosome-binding protein